MSSEVELYEKKYPEKWVVIQNRITQAFREMTLDEKRLILLASPLVRLADTDEKTNIEVSAGEFAEISKIDRASAYKQMKSASKKLMKRSFVYVDSNGVDTDVQWVIRAKYTGGTVSLNFTEEVIQLLKVFDRLNPYTKYLKTDILSLKLNYSIDLYHLAKKHERMGGFVMSLDDYRAELGTPKSYNRINNLKENAVEAPIGEINEKTDIMLDYENVKEGKSVVAFKFSVKPNKKNLKLREGGGERNVSSQPKGMTSKQVDMFAPLLANHAGFGSYAPAGKSYAEVVSWLRGELTKPEFLKKYAKQLAEVGYKPL